MQVVRIGIVGDFDRAKRSHWATEAALFHAAARVGVAVEPHWVSTASLAAPDGVRQLAAFDALWGAPGSPYLKMDGALAAIRYAREHDAVYLGTCAGFQYAVIEFSRNVLGIADADSAENESQSKNIVISMIYCDAPGSAGAPLLAGPGIARPVPGSLLQRLCGSGELAEEYFCSFEVNPDFAQRWLAAGMRIGARGAEGELRAVELSERRFFLATLFQPQLSSSFDRPHPIVDGFLRASLERRAHQH